MNLDEMHKKLCTGMYFWCWEKNVITLSSCSSYYLENDFMCNICTIKYSWTWQNLLFQIIFKNILLGFLILPIISSVEKSYVKRCAKNLWLFLGKTNCLRANFETLNDFYYFISIKSFCLYSVFFHVNNTIKNFSLFVKNLAKILCFYRHL